MLNSPTATCRVRAFDFILNLGVHALLLEPMVTDDASAIEEDYSQESYFDSEAKLANQEIRSDSVLMGTSSAIDNFESWILNILYEILLLLVQVYFLSCLIQQYHLGCMKLSAKVTLNKLQNSAVNLS